MKTLGLIGGTSWLSTVEYYRNINQLVNERLGGLNSAKMFLYSLNLEEFKPPVDPAAWKPTTEHLISIAQSLETAGAECLIICANTPHMVADIIQRSIGIPLIHIAEATALEIKKQGLKKVALLGTRITMEQSFYTDKLSAHGIETIIPETNDREFINNSIFTELGKGLFTTDTKERYLQIIEKLIQQGAEGMIFGCTEIPLLINQAECQVPIIDTTVIHSKAAVDFALQ